MNESNRKEEDYWFYRWVYKKWTGIALNACMLLPVYMVYNNLQGNRERTISAIFKDFFKNDERYKNDICDQGSAEKLEAIGRRRISAYMNSRLNGPVIPIPYHLPKFGPH